MCENLSVKKTGWKSVHPFWKFEAQRSRSQQNQTWWKIQFWDHNPIEMNQIWDFVSQKGLLEEYSTFLKMFRLSSNDQMHFKKWKVILWPNMDKFQPTPITHPSRQWMNLVKNIYNISTMSTSKGQSLGPLHDQIYCFGVITQVWPCCSGDSAGQYVA